MKQYYTYSVQSIYIFRAQGGLGSLRTIFPTQRTQPRFSQVLNSLLRTIVRLRARPAFAQGPCPPGKWRRRIANHGFLWTLFEGPRPLTSVSEDGKFQRYAEQRQNYNPTKLRRTYYVFVHCKADFSS